MIRNIENNEKRNKPSPVTKYLISGILCSRGIVANEFNSKTKISASSLMRIRPGRKRWDYNKREIMYAYSA